MRTENTLCRGRGVSVAVGPSRDATIRPVAGRRPVLRVTLDDPSALAGAASDPSATFERLWRRLTTFHGNNALCFIDEDGGLFLKGQRFRPSANPESLLQSGRLLREVRNLLWLHANGIPVPGLVLHGAERRFGVPTRSVLVLRRLHACESLKDVLHRTDPGARADLWKPVGELVAAMHARGFFHRDLTARNLLVQRSGGAVRVLVIDCPRGEIRPLALRRPFLGRADRFRLVRSILAAGGSDDEARTLLACCGAQDADDVLAMARRSVDGGSVRTPRIKLWVAFGV